MDQGWIDEWMDQKKEGWIKDYYMNEWIKGRLNWLRMIRWQDQLNERWMDYGWVDGRMD